MLGIFLFTIRKVKLSIKKNNNRRNRKIKREEEGVSGILRIRMNRNMLKTVLKICIHNKFVWLVLVLAMLSGI